MNGGRNELWVWGKKVGGLGAIWENVKKLGKKGGLK